MKRICFFQFYLLLFVIVSSCSSGDSKTGLTPENEDVVDSITTAGEDVSNSLVDSQSLVKPLDTEQKFEKEQLKFSIVETIEYDINGDKMKIIIEKIDSWFCLNDNGRIDWNDPGDFHRIKIEYKNMCYTFFNSGGWDKPRPYDFRYVSNFTKYNKIKSDYLVLTKNNEDFLLFAFGYTYASEPGLLSIINLSTPKPELIFNDNYEISGYWENKPKIIVSYFSEDDNENKYDTLLLINHRLQKK